ncbi:MAG: NAD(P)/FAD-dependent oxidoreductase [Alphaproteobacteria bacterium]|nr:NAD(P)/FAD-dependent oxidoreductase [Alphaproteobacteria bacterium]MBV9372303.1 NAD(P)/FAD-dependent oxidoreductase [Alphaproteobacteria bacterium]MBV9899595.1 NAD(P)/FAD-dependent oxidoreductase [Alphaproteobacteria bacterium]
MSAVPRVVIVGAGFGGIEAARALRKAPVDVTILDRRNFHLFQPLLYQVATAALSAGDIAWPVRSIFRRQRNARVLLAEVTGVDRAARRLRVEGGAAVPYDHLVLATGARHSYFGHDEWSDAAPGLKGIDDAMLLRGRLLAAFERAELAEDPAEQRRLMTIVIVGGGPTGVELAGAVAELAHNSLSGEFRAIDPREARIVLVETGPRLLGAYPEPLSDVARRSLEKMQVEVRTDTAVTAADAGGVTIGDGKRIEAATLAWAAGVAASPAARWLGAPHDHAGRVEVAPDLSVPGHPEICVVGDTAAVARADGRPVPGIAPAAKQMGRYAGRRIAAQVAGRPAPAPFVYRHHGDLATIGRMSAVVSLGPVRLTGLIGWLFWSAIHIWFLIGFRSRIVVAMDWAWSYLTFQRGARLIPERRGREAP